MPRSHPHSTPYTYPLVRSQDPNPLKPRARALGLNLPGRLPAPLNAITDVPHLKRGL